LIEQSASRPKASALASELGVADGFEVGEAVDDQQVGPSVRERPADAVGDLIIHAPDRRKRILIRIRRSVDRKQLS
jgi:hypothetical protein